MTQHSSNAKKITNNPSHSTVGKWSSANDNSVCTSCPENSATASTGSTSAGQCICDVGYFLDGSSCASCPNLHTTTSTGSTSIDLCDVFLGGMVLVSATTGNPPSSGGNRCAVEGNCISNYDAGENYGHYELCTFRLNGISGPLVFEHFDVSSIQNCRYESLTIAGTKYCGGPNIAEAPTGLEGEAGSEITWRSYFASNTGFKVCVAYCPNNCATGSGCELDGSTSSCTVCPGEQKDPALESRPRK